MCPSIRPRPGMPGPSLSVLSRPSPAGRPGSACRRRLEEEERKRRSARRWRQCHQWQYPRPPCASISMSISGRNACLESSDHHSHLDINARSCRARSSRMPPHVMAWPRPPCSLILHSSGGFEYRRLSRGKAGEVSGHHQAAVCQCAASTACIYHGGVRGARRRSQHEHSSYGGRGGRWWYARRGIMRPMLRRVAWARSISGNPSKQNRRKCRVGESSMRIEGVKISAPMWAHAPLIAGM